MKKRRGCGRDQGERGGSLAAQQNALRSWIVKGIGYRPRVED